MIDFHNSSSLAKRWLLRDFFHRENRTARHVEWIEYGHHFHLAHGHRPLLDCCKYLVEFVQAGVRRVVFGIGEPVFMTDDFRQSTERLRLSDDINVGVLIRFPALAAHDPTRMSAAGCVTGAGHGGVEATIEILRVFLEWPAGEALLVAQLHAAEIQNGVLHRACDPLAAARLLAL